MARVDLPVEVLPNLFAPREAVHSFDRVAHELDQLATVSTAAVDFGVARPVGGRLDGLARLRSQFGVAVAPQAAKAVLLRRIVAEETVDRLDRGNENLAQGIVFRVGQHVRNESPEWIMLAQNVKRTKNGLDDARTIFSLAITSAATVAIPSFDELLQFSGQHGAD